MDISNGWSHTIRDLLCLAPIVLLLRNIMFSRFIYVVAYISTSSLFMAYNILFWGYTTFLKIILFLLAALGLHCCVRAFSSCGERGLLFVVVRRLLVAVASLVAEHGL